MIRLRRGPGSNFACLLSACVIMLLSSGCGDEPEQGSCLSVGSGFGDPINGGVFLEELLDIYGLKFSQEFMRRRAVERKVSALNIVLPKGQLESVMTLTERDFFASHSGKKAAIENLKSYGLSMEDWKRLTSDRVRFGLLAKALMKVEPSEKMIASLFEKRYGKDGERREIRYLYVSSAAASQTIIKGEKLKTKLAAFEARIRARLSIVRESTETDTLEVLKKILKDLQYSLVKDLRNTDLRLDVTKVLEGVVPGVWSEIFAENDQLKIFRRLPGPSRQAMVSARFEQVIVPVSAAQLITSELKDTVRSGAKVRAEKLFTRINKKPDRFSLEARVRSDHATSKQRGGRFRTFEPQNIGLSSKVTDAVLKLDKPGQMIMVEDDAGFHIVRLELLNRVAKSKVLKSLLEEMSRKDYSDTQVNQYINGLVEDGAFNIRLQLDPRCRATAIKAQ